MTIDTDLLTCMTYLSVWEFRFPRYKDRHPTENKECVDIRNVPVGFKLRVSFSPLHTDDNHPVENKETRYWYSPVSHENHNSKCQIKMVRPLKELNSHTLTILQPCLQDKSISMRCVTVVVT